MDKAGRTQPEISVVILNYNGEDRKTESGSKVTALRGNFGFLKLWAGLTSCIVTTLDS